METLINPIELLVQINAKLDRIEEILRKFDASDYFEKTKILTVDETSALLHVSKRTLQRYRDNRLIRYSQTGSKITFRMSDVLQFLEENGIQPYKRRNDRL
jgi:excisionase family DNA binding protein